MLVFAISVHASKFFFPGRFDPAALAVQTVIYLLTAPLFMRFVRGRFLYVLRNTGPGTSRRLNWLSLMWFFTAVVVNLAFVMDTGWLRLAALLLLAGNAVLSYSLLYTIVQGMKDIENLEKVVFTDQLTGLPNRNSLLYEAEKRIREGLPFYLLFMDLDRFKSVNDRYGHQMGDDYLRRFSHELMERAHEEGTLFRLSGDEFVFVGTGGEDERQALLNRLKNLDTAEMPVGRPFLGVSCGSASYPEDAGSFDELIRLADEDMYRQKVKRHNGLR